MSEFLSSGTPLIEMVDVEDSMATQLLNDPEVKRGLWKVEERLDDTYYQLKENGSEVEPIFDGTTEDGLGVTIAKVTKPDWSYDFLIFTYPLDCIRDTEYVNNLEPRETAIVARNVGGAQVALAKPGGAFTVSLDDLEKARKAGLKRRNPDAFNRLAEEVNGQLLGTTVDRLSIPESLVSGVVTLNAEPVKVFAWHAFGNRRRAVIERVIEPLVQAENRLRHRDRFSSDFFGQGCDELFRRGQQIKETMLKNADVIDRATEEFVFDPVKTKHMADAMNRAAASERGGEALRAAAEYDADPAGIKARTKK